jgi:predicted O-methyltransferase YrrM
MDTLNSSDKQYWHRFIPAYDAAFKKLSRARRIVEIGVLRGASVRWLANIFPDAEIIGADILAVQPSWPQGPRITYRALDQADRIQVGEFFDSIGEVDLIIEDGSHIPQHQATCLAMGLPHLRPGGLYVLEDIATSHPRHPTFGIYSRRGGKQLPTALHVLLALQHLRDTSTPLTQRITASLTDPDFFSVADIERLWNDIATADLHKRTQLPLACYACGGMEFDYLSWKCRCGVDLYETADSMTYLIWKR